MSAYQPKTGQRCSCRRGIQRDNCPACEGTGWRIDFARIRRALDEAMLELDLAAGGRGPRMAADGLPGDGLDRGPQ